MLQLQRRHVRAVDDLPVSPPAQRGNRSRLRDPRLLLGVCLVAVAMGAGALLLGSRTAGVPVVRAAHDLPAGVALGADDFETAVIDLPDGAPYLTSLPTGDLVLTAPLAAGEFVPSDALDPRARADVRMVTVPVEPVHAPVGIAAGMRVDVWATSSLEGSTPTLAIRDVLVAATSADAENSTGQIGVVLEVPTSQAAAVVAAAHAGSVDLVALPDGGAR